MGWSEYTTFTVKDNRKNIQKIENALKDGDALPEPFKKCRLHFCEFASRLGAITIEEVLNLYKLADSLPEAGYDSEKRELFAKRGLPYNCTTVEPVETGENYIVFEVEIFKDSYYYECNTLLKKIFPKAKITYTKFDTLDELW